MVNLVRAYTASVVKYIAKLQTKTKKQSRAHKQIASETEREREKEINLKTNKCHFERLKGDFFVQAKKSNLSTKNRSEISKRNKRTESWKRQKENFMQLRWLICSMFEQFWIEINTREKKTNKKNCIGSNRVRNQQYKPYGFVAERVVICLHCLFEICMYLVKSQVQ